jgi:hypothetical protein
MLRFVPIVVAALVVLLIIVAMIEPRPQIGFWIASVVAQEASR